MNSLLIGLACAWILWIHGANKDFDKWQRIEAFETKDECIVAAKKTPYKSNEVLLECWPDTVDPRN